MAIVESTMIDERSRPGVSLELSPPDTTVMGDGGMKPLIEAQSVAARRMTVSYIGPSMPYLRLQGRWLDRAGFRIGTRVRVEVSERRLIVEALETEEGRCPS